MHSKPRIGSRGMAQSRSIRGPGKTTYHRPAAPKGLQRGSNLPMNQGIPELRGVGFNVGRSYSYMDRFKKQKK